MRFLMVTVSTAAALTLIAASALMNWVFMTSLGKSELEQKILGAVSIAVSAFIALLPTLLVWAWRERRALYVMLGVPVFLAFAAFSLSSAVGFAAKNRGSLGEDRTLATARLAEVKREIEETETAEKAFGTPRSSAVLQELLRGVEQDRRWQSTKACTEATADASRSFCKEYFELKAEAARASESGHLLERIAGLKRERDRLQDQGAGREADNQAAVLGRLLGFQPSEVERSLTLFLAALVEVGAALGLYFATGHMRPGSPRHGGAGNRITVIDGEVLRSDRLGKVVRAPLKQIAAATPRRVPRLKQS
jgi:hypothetical protein